MASFTVKTGQVGWVGDLKSTNSGLKNYRFSFGWKTRSGMSWAWVSCWGRIAEQVAEMNLQKGDMAVITGEDSLREVQGKGKEYDIKLSTIERIGAPAEQPAPQERVHDDIPF